MKSQMITGALCLVLGVGIGYLVADSDQVAPQDGAESRVVERLRQRPDDSRRSSMVNDSPASDRLPLDGGDELVTVPASLIRGITNTPPITSCRNDLFRKDDQVEALLKISPHERERMEQAWELSRKKVESLEVSTSRSEVNEDGSVSITVPDLSQSLKPVGEAFSDELELVLGPERGRLFLAMKQVGRVFTPECGERKHHIAVESVGDGNWRYHMTYEDEHNRRVWVGDGVPNEIRHITDAARVQPSLAEALKGQ